MLNVECFWAWFSGSSSSNALACMLCCSVDELPDNVDSDGTPDSHDELIKTYECEIRKFHEVLVDEWLPEKVGLVLSKSGRALVNWPLHCMSEHEPG